MQGSFQKKFGKKRKEIIESETNSTCILGFNFQTPLYMGVHNWVALLNCSTVLNRRIHGTNIRKKKIMIDYINIYIYIDIYVTTQLIENRHRGNFRQKYNMTSHWKDLLLLIYVCVWSYNQANANRISRLIMCDIEWYIWLN